jgi:hypothetical protein
MCGGPGKSVSDCGASRQVALAVNPKTSKHGIGQSWLLMLGWGFEIFEPATSGYELHTNAAQLHRKARLLRSLS